MSRALDQKSSLEDIRERFDNYVERFSNLDTGQTATVDAPLDMELIAQAAAASTPNIRRVLDIGCGAGNNTLKLLQYVPSFDCDLVDLSLPVLKRAEERISSVNSGKIRAIQGVFRESDFSALYAGHEGHECRSSPRRDESATLSETGENYE